MSAEIVQRYQNLTRESQVAFPGYGLAVFVDPEPLCKKIAEGYLCECLSFRRFDVPYRRLMLDMVSGAGFAGRFHDEGKASYGYLEVRFRPQSRGEWFAKEEPLESASSLLKWAETFSERPIHVCNRFEREIRAVAQDIQTAISKHRQGFSPPVGGIRIDFPSSDFDERRAFARFLRQVGFGFVLSNSYDIGIRWEPTTHPTLGLMTVYPGQSDFLFGSSATRNTPYDKRST